MDSPTPENSPDSAKITRPAGSTARQPLQPGSWMLLLILGMAMAASLYLTFGATASARVDYSFFLTQLKEKNVKNLIRTDETLQGEWKTPPTDPTAPANQKRALPARFTATPPLLDEGLNVLLNDAVLKDKLEYDNSRNTWGQGANLLISLAGLVLMVVFMFFILRRSSDPMGAGGMVSNFIRSPAKRFKASETPTTFDDVAGMEQAKRELQEVVEFLKNPMKFQRLGAQIPKGVLLMGPPGTGKTLMARATAGEAGVPFFSINGSEFIQMFVGVGASRVRDMFKTAKEAAPCILFIDEIDAVGRIRGAGVGGGHDEREQTLNQILGEMDGFTPSEAVIVLAATNRADVLDPALLRPGRFDRHVTVDRPTKAGRKGILLVHTRKVPLAQNVDLDRVAASTTGFSGADLKNLVNEAALFAARTGQTQVSAADFEQARDRVMMGAVREDILTEHEKEMTAYHEAGHAVIAWLLPEMDALHKVTIIPRGRALGVTQLTNQERFDANETYLRSMLTMTMGGRAAEKMIFNEYTAGVESDLKQATRIARLMVAHWGMSPVIGPVAFRQSEEHPFLGKEMHENREFSEETARIIDQEVQSLLVNAASQATELLTTHKDLLEKLTRALLDKEVLDYDEILTLFGMPPVSKRAVPVSA